LPVVLKLKVFEAPTDELLEKFTLLVLVKNASAADETTKLFELTVTGLLLLPMLPVVDVNETTDGFTSPPKLLIVIAGIDWKDRVILPDGGPALPPPPNTDWMSVALSLLPVNVMAPPAPAVPPALPAPMLPP
jgi:hypothetical protein